MGFVSISVQWLCLWRSVVRCAVVLVARWWVPRCVAVVTTSVWVLLPRMARAERLWLLVLDMLSYVACAWPWALACVASPRVLHCVLMIFDEM